MNSISIPDLIIGGALLYFGQTRRKGGLRTAMTILGVLGVASAFVRDRNMSVGLHQGAKSSPALAQFLNPRGDGR